MNLSLLLKVPLEIQVHTICALSALFWGLYVLMAKKGGLNHRICGWIWALLMIGAAISALFIHGFKLIWLFSPIHIFVPLTFWGLYDGIRHARAGRIRAHRSAMLSMYWAALCIPLAFALMPGRLISRMFGTTELGWIPMIIAATIVLSVGAYYRWESFWQKTFNRIYDKTRSI